MSGVLLLLSRQGGVVAPEISPVWMCYFDGRIWIVEGVGFAVKHVTVACKLFTGGCLDSILLPPDIQGC